MKITLNEKQLHLICNAVEYLGRHGIGQKDFKPVMLESRIKAEDRETDARILLDMWKCIMHFEHYYQGGTDDSVSVHKFPTMQMGTEELIKIEDDLVSKKE